RVRAGSRPLWDQTWRRTLDNISGSEVPLEGGGTTLPMKRLSMRQLKEVLRLRYELGLGQHQIASSCSIAQGTVSEYLRHARKAGKIANWKPPYLQEPRGTPTQPTSPSRILPNSTKDSNAILT